MRREQRSGTDECRGRCENGEYETDCGGDLRGWRGDGGCLSGGMHQTASADTARGAECAADARIKRLPGALRAVPQRPHQRPAERAVAARHLQEAVSGQRRAGQRRPRDGRGAIRAGHDARAGQRHDSAGARRPDGVSAYAVRARFKVQGSRFEEQRRGLYNLT